MEDFLNVGDKIIVGSKKDIIIGLWSTTSIKSAYEILKKERYSDYELEKEGRCNFQITAYDRYPEGFTPPVYGKAYFESMEILNSILYQRNH